MDKEKPPVNMVQFDKFLKKILSYKPPKKIWPPPHKPKEKLLKQKYKYDKDTQTISVEE